MGTMDDLELRVAEALDVTCYHRSYYGDGGGVCDECRNQRIAAALRAAARHSSGWKAVPFDDAIAAGLAALKGEACPVCKKRGRDHHGEQCGRCEEVIDAD